MSFRKEYVEGFADELNALLQEDGGLDLKKDADFKSLMDFLYEYIDRLDADETKTNLQKADDLKNAKSKFDELLESSAEQLFDIREGAVTEGLDRLKQSDNRSAERQNRRKDEIIELLKRISAKIKEYSFLGNNYDIKGDRKDNLSEMRRSNKKYDKIVEAIVGSQKKDDKALSKFTKSFEAETNKSYLELMLLNKFHLAKMSRETKAEITLMQTKLFKRLKLALGAIGAFYLFGAVKKLAAGIVGITQPMFQPFINWFMRNMPALKDYLGELSKVLAPIAKFVKPIADFYKEWFSSEEERKRMEAAMYNFDENGNIELIKLDQVRDVAKMRGEDFARMAAYAATGASIGSFVGAVMGSAGVVVGGPLTVLAGKVSGAIVGAAAGFVVGFVKSKVDQFKRINELKTHYDSIKADLEKLIMLLEQVENPDPYAIQAAKVQMAKIDYSLQVIKLAKWEQGAFFGLHVFNDERSLRKYSKKIKDEEAKLARISDETAAERAEAAEATMTDYVKAQLRDTDAISDIRRTMSSESDSSANSAQQTPNSEIVNNNATNSTSRTSSASYTAGASGGNNSTDNVVRTERVIETTVVVQPN